MVLESGLYRKFRTGRILCASDGSNQNFLKHDSSEWLRKFYVQIKKAVLCIYQRRNHAVGYNNCYDPIGGKMDSFEMAIGAPLFLFQNAHEIKNKMGKAISVIE